MQLIKAFSAHKDHVNLYTDAKRYRFNLNRGVHYNRLKASDLLGFMSQNELKFNDKVVCILGIENTVKEFHKLLEYPIVTMLKFWLETQNIQVTSLTTNSIRVLYAPLMIGYKTKPIKTLAEIGFINTYGIEKWKEHLEDSSMCVIDSILTYAIKQPRCFE